MWKTAPSWEKAFRLLQKDALPSLENAQSLKRIENLRISLLGRNGRLTRLLKSLVQIPLQERRRLGPPAQKLREDLELLLERKTSQLKKAAWEGSLSKGYFDPTLPGYPHPGGSPHPLTQVLDEILAIFEQMGFRLEEGPLVETDSMTSG